MRSLPRIAFVMLIALAGCGSRSAEVVKGTPWTTSNLDVVAGPTFSNDKVFVVAQAGSGTVKLVALDVSSGAEKWHAMTTPSFNDGADGVIRPVVDKDLVIAPFSERSTDGLIAYDVNTGTIRWKHAYWTLKQPWICGMQRICTTVVDRDDSYRVSVLDTQTGVETHGEPDARHLFGYRFKDADIETNFATGIVRRRSPDGASFQWTLDIYKETGVDVTNSSSATFNSADSDTMIVSLSNEKDPAGEHAVTVGIKPYDGKIVWTQRHVFKELLYDDHKSVLLRDNAGLLVNVDAKTGKQRWIGNHNLDWTSVGSRHGDGIALKDSDEHWVVLHNNGTVGPPVEKDIWWFVDDRKIDLIPWDQPATTYTINEVISAKHLPSLRVDEVSDKTIPSYLKYTHDGWSLWIDAKGALHGLPGTKSKTASTTTTTSAVST